MKDYGESKQLQFLNKTYSFIKDCIGESPADVFILDNRKTSEKLFLKISSKDFSFTTYSVEREMLVLKWLADKTDVPTVVDYFENEDYQFLLMKSIIGLPILDTAPSGNTIVDSFVNGIKTFQSINVDDCPFDSSMKKRLKELKYLVNKNLAAFDDFYESELPFDSPEDLISYLENNMHPEEIVFSHGDFQESNIFISKKLGFIDWGRGGKADKWCDIAHAYQNIKEQLEDQKYINRFFEKLELEPDWDKINFHLWLDELF